MLAARLNDRPVVIRELLPQDLKLEIEQLTHSEAIGAARFLATVVGEAHARQMDRSTRLAWRTAMQQKHTKTLDAPSWFWSSIVELVATHEAAYLSIAGGTNRLPHDAPNGVEISLGLAAVRTSASQ